MDKWMVLGERVCLCEGLRVWAHATMCLYINACSYLGLFLLCEVIFYVECLPDLLGGFAFDHVGHRLAGDIQQAFDVQIVGGLNTEQRHGTREEGVRGGQERETQKNKERKRERLSQSYMKQAGVGRPPTYLQYYYHHSGWI